MRCAARASGTVTSSADIASGRFVIVIYHLVIVNRFSSYDGSQARAVFSCLGSLAGFRAMVPEDRERELQAIRWRDAGSQLLRHLVSLKAIGKLSAADLCIACHYCHEGGVLGADFSQYAGRPGLQTGRYNQILDNVLPKSGPVVFERVPCMTTKTSVRSYLDVPLSAVWESAWTDVQQNPSIITTADSMTLPPIYHDHPVVKDAKQKKTTTSHTPCSFCRRCAVYLCNGW